MKRVAGALVAIAIMAVSGLAAGAVGCYLIEYGPARIAVAAGIGAAGAVAAVLVYLLVVRAAKGSRRPLVVLLLVGLAIGIPGASTVYPGRVTASRFGLTVYGAIPLPVLDITVNGQGWLWFRDKSHWVSLEEVEALLSPEVEVVVIGTGWQEAVAVDPRVAAMERVEVHVLPTPAAFELFNLAKWEGKRVVLLAHSSC